MALEVVVSTNAITTFGTFVPARWNSILRNRSVVRMFASHMSKHVLLPGKPFLTVHNLLISRFTGYMWFVFLLIMSTAMGQQTLLEVKTQYIGTRVIRFNENTHLYSLGLGNISLQPLYSHRTGEERFRPDFPVLSRTSSD